MLLFDSTATLQYTRPHMDPEVTLIRLCQNNSLTWGPQHRLSGHC